MTTHMPMQLHDQSGHVAGEREQGERHGAHGFFCDFLLISGYFLLSFGKVIPCPSE